MFESLRETRGDHVLLGKWAVSTAFLLHSLILLALVGTSILATIDAGDPPPMPWVVEIVNISDAAFFRDDLDPPRGGATALPPREGPSHEGRDHAGADPDPVQPPPPEDPSRLGALDGAAVSQETDPTVQDPEGPRSDSEAMPANVSGEDGSSSGPDGPGPGGAGPGEGDETGQGGGDPGSIVGPSDPGVEPPVLIYRVDPIYPAIARAARLQGTVVLSGVIGADGRIESLTVVRSIPVLDEAALDAVAKWIYRPGRQHGYLVRVGVTIKVEFRLD